MTSNLLLDPEIHIDHRRELFDWGIHFEAKSLKLLKLNAGVTVGEHFHLEKDELFILTEGRLSVVEVGELRKTDLVGPICFLVPRGLEHSFKTETKATLVCLATEKFDSTDEIRCEK